MHTIWTEERIELLLKLNAQGLSTAAIAKEFGDTSKNAIVGKLARLRANGGVPAPSRGIGAYRQPPKVAKTAATPKRFKQKKQSTEPVGGDNIIPLILKVTLNNITDSQCRWPIGDPLKKDFYFCGDHTIGKHPYCRSHAHIAYRPQPTKRANHY